MKRPESESTKSVLVNKKLYILLFFIFGSLNGQEIDSLSVRIDSSHINVREFNRALKESYSGRDFDYQDSIEGEAENFIARGINWFFRKIGELFGVKLSPETLNFLELLTYILLIILAIVLIAKLLSGRDAGALFSKKNSSVNNFNVREEHIERIDFDTLISDALAQNNYRLALRYRFLKLLKELSKAGYIQWHFEKTNSDYYKELKTESVRSGFKEVSYLYDYVWYGEFTLDARGFEEAQYRFEKITKSLSNAQ